jgi:hypothetical protein
VDEVLDGRAIGSESSSTVTPPSLFPGFSMGTWAVKCSRIALIVLKFIEKLQKGGVDIEVGRLLEFQPCGWAM